MAELKPCKSGCIGTGVYCEEIMSVKIAGMEMPKSCWGCKFSQISVIHNTSVCLLQAITSKDHWKAPSIIEKGKKDAYCPLQEVKE